MSAVRPADLEMRRATAADDFAILELLQASLKWTTEARFASLRAWKHRENAFGPSSEWVAVTDGHLVGYRAFMRWEWEDRDGVVRAVRAVDTATHPDYQGRGIFSGLTKLALEDLAADGVGFVFNTPNKQSGPGYVKMGWVMLGRPRVMVRPRPSLRAVARVARARATAERWSLATDLGVSAPEAFADTSAIEALLATQPAATELRTHRTVPFLRWRYGLPELAYRVVGIDDDPRRGFVVFRIRRRGAAVEAAICDFLVPDDDPRLVAAAIRPLTRRSRADHAVAVARPGLRRAGFIWGPRLGPVLAWRAVTRNAQPSLDLWQLTLGDVELF
jgi:predicted N-acetyltransferase YhbS